MGAFGLRTCDPSKAVGGTAYVFWKVRVRVLEKEGAIVCIHSKKCLFALLEILNRCQF